jgi:hypothetical protein
MDSEIKRRASAGSTLDDYCRPCKMVRRHTVLVASPEGEAIRVLCDHCGSQHNYRAAREPYRPHPKASDGSPRPRTAATTHGAFPLVGERERSFPKMSLEGQEVDLETMLRRIIREESGLTAVVPADKWQGGELVLRPGREGLQEKSVPIETFFHKIVMLRNRLRTLEQQVNASDLENDAKVKLQSYITACYGSLTSFNVLFADEDDRFKGSGGK